MSTINPGLGRLLAGSGGVLVLASLFMPWSESAGATRTGWETLPAWDVFLVITGVCGVVAAVTAGRFGFFRPDLSFNAMTDIFGVVLVILIGWLILVDFPDGAGREAGVYLALVGAAVIATGAGDSRHFSLSAAVRGTTISSEPVAHSAHGFNPTLAKLSAQVADVDLHTFEPGS